MVRLVSFGEQAVPANLATNLNFGGFNSPEAVRMGRSRRGVFAAAKSPQHFFGPSFFGRPIVVAYPRDMAPDLITLLLAAQRNRAR